MTFVIAVCVAQTVFVRSAQRYVPFFFFLFFFFFSILLSKFLILALGYGTDCTFHLCDIGQFHIKKKKKKKKQNILNVCSQEPYLLVSFPGASITCST